MIFAIAFFIILGTVFLWLWANSLELKPQASLLLMLLFFLGYWFSWEAAESLSERHYEQRVERIYNIEIRSHGEEHVIYGDNCAAIKGPNDTLIHKGCESHEVGEEN